MWRELRFVVEQASVDAWSDALLDAGAVAVQAEDADEGSATEQALFGEPGEPPPAQGWRSTRLAAMIDAQMDAATLLAAAARGCAHAIPSDWTLEDVPEQDWVRVTQAQFEPIPIGNRLLITPSWHLDRLGPEDAQRGEALRHRIVLDPGLAFGTGSHPTTRLCLEWLDAHLISGASVVDYGCGSGILAIAAARLGASPVLAIDIDPQAVDSTRANARINDVQIEARCPSNEAIAPAAVVLANILANPLRLLAPLLTSLVAPGGTLVLAGLLDRQAEELARAYSGLNMQAWRSLEGWTCLTGSAAR